MVRVHLLLKLVDQDPQRMWLQDQSFHLHNLSKEVMGATQAIFNRDMVFMVAKLVLHTLELAELAAIKLLDKVTKTANMVVATKLSEAITMATLNNVVVADGVATMDTNGLTTGSARPWLNVAPHCGSFSPKLCYYLIQFSFALISCANMDHWARGEEI
jgi:hypothetical protein